MTQVSEFGTPTLPTTGIPQLPPAGALDFVAEVHNRIVLMGFSAELDRFYTFDSDRIRHRP